MFETFDFDDGVDRAWKAFTLALADHLTAMRTDDTLTLDWLDETTVDGFAPWIQFLLWDDEYVRAEVSSNPYLAPRYALDAESENRLCALGWQRPTHLPADAPGDGSSAFFVDVETRRSDQLAALTVTTLREIWNVPHPSFLRAEIKGSLEGTALAGIAADDPEPDPEPPLDPDTAVTPRDVSELRTLFARTVAQTLGFVPDNDSDGDVVLQLDEHTVFVIAHPDRPLVRVWMPLLHGITTRARAAEQLCDLTLRWSAIRFLLDDDQLSASIDVSAQPFVPRHLTEALEQIRMFGPHVDEAFAAGFGGTLYDGGQDIDAGADGRDEDDDDQDECGLPHVLLTLFTLSSLESVHLSSDDLATMCEYDLDVALDYLGTALGLETSCHQSAVVAYADDDPEEADACEHRARVWARVHTSLYAALRAIPRPDTTHTTHSAD